MLSMPSETARGNPQHRVARNESCRLSLSRIQVRYPCFPCRCVTSRVLRCKPLTLPPLGRRLAGKKPMRALHRHPFPSAVHKTRLRASGLCTLTLRRGLVYLVGLASALLHIELHLRNVFLLSHSCAFILAAFYST